MLEKKSLKPLAKKPMSGLKKKVIGGIGATALAASGTAGFGKLTGKGPLGGLRTPSAMTQGAGQAGNLSVSASNEMSYSKTESSDDSVKDDHSNTQNSTSGDSNSKQVGGDDNSKSVGNVSAGGDANMNF